MGLVQYIKGGVIGALLGAAIGWVNVHRPRPELNSMVADDALGVAFSTVFLIWPALTFVGFLLGLLTVAFVNWRRRRASR